MVFGCLSYLLALQFLIQFLSPFQRRRAKPNESTGGGREIYGPQIKLYLLNNERAPPNEEICLLRSLEAKGSEMLDIDNFISGMQTKLKNW